MQGLALETFQFGMKVGRQHLKGGMSDHDYVAFGLGKALNELWIEEGIHPSRIAGLALEDANHHPEASASFAISGDLKVVHRTMTPAEILEATNDNTIKLVVVVPFEFHELTSDEDFDELVDEKVCADGFLSNMTYKPVGVANGKILIEVTACSDDAIGDL